MSQKLHNPKLHSPAVYIPCWLIQVPQKLLSHGAKLLYGRLSMWSNATGKVFRSCPELSQEIGVPVRTVERYINELKTCKLIGTYHPQAGGKNHFEFYDHPWMHDQINDNLLYSSTTPPNLVLDNNCTDNPPSKMTVPPVKNDGTPPSKVADINIKEIKRNTTTTEPSVQPEKSHPEPVVVTTSFLNPKPQNQLTADESSSTDFLTKLYEDHPVITNHILGLEDFLSAAYWLIRNRGDTMLNARRKGIKTLVESGRFEGDDEWIKFRISEKNKKKGDEQQRLIKTQMRERSKHMESIESVKSVQCLPDILKGLTGDANYKENKAKEANRLARVKIQIQQDLEKPKKPKGFKRARLPEELRAN
jgi:Arc/MetJ-type ribon-helix-helix transcriptional regulator